MRYAAHNTKSIYLQAQMVQSSMIEKKQVYSAFRKAEQHMIVALKARKGEIKVSYIYSGQDSS